MIGPTPIDPGELAPATGAPQPLEGWRGADVDPSEYVGDEWIAEHTLPLGLHITETEGRFGASSAGWTRDTVRRVAARTGLPVVEAWSSHDLGAMGTVVAPLLHQTATPTTIAGDYPTLRVVRDGRPGLENSLCMYGLGRSGTVYLISERLSWHAGAGAYGGITDGNGHLAGIEAESDGRAWTPEQIDAYPRLVASILLETGRGADWTPRHADYALPAGRKTDTSGLDINALRATVAHYLAHPEQITRDGGISMAVEDTINTMSDLLGTHLAPAIGRLDERTAVLMGEVAAIRGAVAAIAADPDITPESLAGVIEQAVAASFDPEAIAAALPDDLAEQLAAKLAERLAS